MIGPVEAEEALLALRVAVEPWRDPKRGDDGWVRRLQTLAQAGQPEPPARPLTPEEAPNWGIKVIKAPSAGISPPSQSTEKGG